MRVSLEGVNIRHQFILNASFSACIIWLREVIELRVLNGYIGYSTLRNRVQ